MGSLSRLYAASRVWLAAAWAVGLLPVALCAQTGPVGVVVMPFEVHARPELAYLQEELPEAVRRQLAAAGAAARLLDRETAESWRRSADSDAALARLGTQTGADYLVTGSLTWIGQSFSLDARLLATAGDRPAAPFSAVGEGVENLPAAVRRLVEEMGPALFRQERIAEIAVQGNQRIESDAIRRVIQSKAGDLFSAKALAADLKAVYAMGYFDDIRIAAEPVPGGQRVVFQVVEKPTVRSVGISGNVVFDDDEIKNSLTLKKGAILNIFAIRNDMRRIEEMYKEKNYHNVQVSHKLTPQSHNQADVEYIVEEGKKIQIKRILFTGNAAFTAGKLKGEIETSEKNILSWFTSAGDLNQEVLNQDAAKLTAFYHNNGYIRARVGEPQVDFEEDGIVVTFKINEGPRFKVGRIDFAGDLILPKTELVKRLKTAPDAWFSRETLRADVLALSDLYLDEGYAYVEVNPRVDQDEARKVADILFQITQGKQVTFENIVITGNTKTRDKVIRRELGVYEEELYGGGRLKRGIRRLNRLDYFQNVKVDTARGSADDRMNLTVEVAEKATGSFTFGAGYGTAENAFLTASISERNLFGRGQTLALRGMLGSRTQRYILSFTEPWLFDIPLSAGTELYKWSYEFEDYTKDSIGARLKLGYPLYDYIRGYLTYTFDATDIRNIDEDAAGSIKRDEGMHYKSSITVMPRYDSRDNVFNAKEGSSHSIEAEVAGLGGDVGFVKLIAETGWYRPLFWKLVGVAHARAGYVQKLPDYDLPDYEKFYLGGINSMRGFTRADLAPVDDQGAPVGGEKFVQFNFELKFPLVEEAGVHAVLFFDTGAVYRKEDAIDLSDLRESAGPEIRWLSPVGPIRLAYGFILDPKKSDNSSGNWEFSMAASF